MQDDTEIEQAREAFKEARKRENATSHHPVSLAKDWTGRGFKCSNVDRHWKDFLEGWMASVKRRG